VARVPRAGGESSGDFEETTVSADNWTICPACKAKAEADRASKTEKAAKAYGKVSAEEFHKFNDAAREPIKLQETMREDYELGTDEDGQFEVSYHASCQVCTFKFAFKHTQDALESRK
jgi:hypothetical protein